MLTLSLQVPGKCRLRNFHLVILLKISTDKVTTETHIFYVYLIETCLSTSWNRHSTPRFVPLNSRGSAEFYSADVLARNRPNSAQSARLPITVTVSVKHFCTFDALASRLHYSPHVDLMRSWKCNWNLYASHQSSDISRTRNRAQIQRTQIWNTRPEMATKIFQKYTTV